MDHLYKIKKKIQALLNKTTKNGASEHEAIAALKKANKLMTEYYISIKDVKDLEKIEKLTTIKIDRYKSRFKNDLFIASLCKLFDCIPYGTSKHLNIHGFSNDVEIVEYFYHFIIEALYKELEKYKKSNEYLRSKKYMHAIKLINGFIKGFNVGVIENLRLMHESRSHKLNEMGIVPYSKSKTVNESLNKAFPNMKTDKSKVCLGDRFAYSYGKSKGNNLKINRGIGKTSKQANSQLN